MKTFTMNSLLGSDEDKNDIYSDNDTWVELDTEVYKHFYQEVKEDGCAFLFELMKVSGQFDFDSKHLKSHYIEYDIPVLILENQSAVQSYFAENILNVPGLVHVDNPQLNDSATCLRCRLLSRRSGLVCLFPFILLPHAPPQNLSDSPLLGHEMVHLRKTLANLYDQNAIRFTYWNKDLQTLVASNLAGALAFKITPYLTEEYEALHVNNDINGVNLAMTQIYIPMALSGCASILDWWLNDENKYLNISRITRVISDTLFDCLSQLGYNDSQWSHPMTPKRWRDVTEEVFREAYKFWQKKPENFVELIRRSLSS